ncbi:selenium metabolism-associated LysR family transcriptional regulator [Calderihabitans maritimus]|uniref:Transcriptional regulator, LysR family n=1 Tax=Calderihabitans maritimus TaxID=1246530 RepID=A0A1Z5HS18_9FIRM|nr:selenium metabolism-associated LysR family transcriptional regulator [Calderihabitans maritimus]GAW92121.1 transcriptional regulator, LysR family [Calderihabitans maritimus]
MNISHFELLCEVARVKSFSKAAKLLHLSQPAVSSQIHSIEDYYGAKLFERSTSGVTLTPVGEIVYQYAKEILRLHEKLEKEIDDLLNTENQKLIIGASSTIGNYAIPCTIWTFKEKYPCTQIKLEVKNTETILSMLANDELDLALLEEPIPKNDGNLKKQPVLNDELLVITPPKKPWVDKTSITLEELKKAPLIIREQGSGLRYMFEKAISGLNVKLPEDFNVIAEMGSTEAIKSAVEAGLGVSICSSLAIKKEIRSGTIHPLRIENAEFQVNYLIVYKNDKQLNNAAKRFIRFLAGPGKDPFC